MNLYKIAQNKKRGYDTYDSAIVCAVDADAAREIHPDGSWESHDRTWCAAPEDVNVEFIGIAYDGLESGLVLASFNAG
jgi:hypothetical protein